MVQSQIRHLNALPGTGAVFRNLALATVKKALAKRSSDPAALAAAIPQKTLHVANVRLDKANLQAYRRLCGFSDRLTVPATYLHLPAFPLHLSLISGADFPLPLAGLVHLRNGITQYRPVSADEVLDYQATLTPGRVGEKGVELDIVTEVTAGGTLVWREVSTNLYRIRANTRSTAKKVATYDQYSEGVTITLPESLGRKYAAVSGDFNPIHLYPWTAKPLGFSRAIIHGMWTHACSLAEIERTLKDTWMQQPFSLDVDFKLPVFLPAEVCVCWGPLESEHGDSLTFAVTDVARKKPHLTGRVKKI